MEIIKVYNHDFLSRCKKILTKHITIDDIFLQRLKNIFNYINPIVFKSLYKSSYKIYTRQIKELNLLYNRFNKQSEPNYIKFIINHEDKEPGLNKSIKNKIKELYPLEWQDTMIIYDLTFLPYSILQYYENECDSILKYVKDHYSINIIYESKLYNEIDLQNIIYHLDHIIDWILSIKSTNNAIKINIVLCPFEKSYSYNSLLKYNYDWLDWVKQYPETKSINPHHINTGVSWHYDNNNNTITLFRIDELFKVLIHELIHSLSIDLHEYETILDKNLNFYVGPIDGYPILINEAYTEYLAIIYWNYYLCNYYFQTDKNVKVNSVFNLFSNMIQNEIINSAINCANLFKYYDITDLTIFCSNNKLKQTTNAFSYIFFKYILLLNLIDFSKDKLNDKANIVSYIRQLLDAKFTLAKINEYQYINLLSSVINEHNIKLKLSVYILSNN